MTVDDAGDGRGSGVGFVLWAIQLTITILASVVAIWLRPFGTTGCKDACDYGLLATSIWGLVWFAIALAVITGVVLVVLYVRGRGRRVWWIPALGIVLTVVAVLISNHLGSVALREDGYCYTYLDCR